MAFVLHEVPNMEKAISECKRILKSNGRLVILEWEAVESEMGPPIHERISSDSLKQFLQKQGLQSRVISLNSSVYAFSVDLK